MVKAAVADWTVTVPVASALLLGAALYLPLKPVLTLACVAALMVSWSQPCITPKWWRTGWASPSERWCWRSRSR